jgi:hypothetical protein
MNSKKKVIAAIALVLALLFVLGFRVSHPQTGLTNALGSAQSGLVIYQKGEMYSAGQKVLATSGDASISPFLGEVVGATGDRYEVGNGRFTESLSSADIKGRMIFVIPFIGTVLGWVGL